MLMAEDLDPAFICMFFKSFCRLNSAETKCPALNQFTSVKSCIIPSGFIKSGLLLWQLFIWTFNYSWPIRSGSIIHLNASTRCQTVKVSSLSVVTPAQSERFNRCTVSTASLTSSDEEKNPFASAPLNAAISLNTQRLYCSKRG